LIYQALKKLGYGYSDNILTKLSTKYPKFGFDVLGNFSLDNLIDPHRPQKVVKINRNSAKKSKSSSFAPLTLSLYVGTLGIFVIIIFVNN
jgi:hypothetical protein